MPEALGRSIIVVAAGCANILWPLLAHGTRRRCRNVMSQQIKHKAVICWSVMDVFYHIKYNGEPVSGRNSILHLMSVTWYRSSRQPVVAKIASCKPTCYARYVKLPISRNRQAYCPFHVMGSTSAHFVKYACLFRESGSTADEILTLECMRT